MLNILDMGGDEAADEWVHPVRSHRRRLHLTQADLAGAVAVSRQTIIAIERGDYAPSVYLALRIAKAMGSTVEALFDQTPEHQEARR